MLGWVCGVPHISLCCMLQVYDLYSGALQQLWRPGKSRAPLVCLQAAELDGHQVGVHSACRVDARMGQARYLRKLYIPAPV